MNSSTHVNRGIHFEVVINGIYKALVKANKEFGLTSKIIMCFLRHLDEKSAFEILDQALDHKDKKADPLFNYKFGLTY